MTGTALAGVLDDAVKAFDLPDGGSIPVNGPNLPTFGSHLTAAGGTLYYTAFGSKGYELYGSDGTLAGTTLLKDINPGGSSVPRNLTAVGNTLFFVAEDGANGSNGFTNSAGNPNLELWKSDGTPAGTQKVKEINSNVGSNGSAGPSDLTNVNGTLFFSARDATGESELWKSDGTSQGTVQVINLPDTGGGSNPFALAKVGNLLYFGANTTDDGFELWKSDGTAGGTQIVSGNPGAEFTFFPENITDVGGTAYFTVDDGTHGDELWKANAAGTSASLVQDLRPNSAGSFPAGITAIGNTAYFKADDGTLGEELYKSTGSSVSLVKDIRVGVGSSRPIGLTDVGGTLFFSADDGTGATGVELYKSDGSPDGTTLVKNINPDTNAIGNAYPLGLTSFGGSLYFYAQDGEGARHGFEPWRSDGTSDGTVMLKDINPGTGNSVPDILTFVPFRGSLFFDIKAGNQIWRLSDTIAPNVTIGSGPASGSTITTASATFGFSSDDAPAIFGCRVYPTGSTPPAFGACSGSGTHTTAALANGSYTFDVQGADISGNTDTDSRSFNVAVPATPVDPGDSAACKKAKADLDAAEGKLDKAKASLKKAKKSKKSAKVKKAKAKVKKAKDAVKDANAAVADSC